jgi:hypothetical protein
MDLARIGPLDLKSKALNIDLLATMGHSAEVVSDESPDRIHLIIGKRAGKRSIELFQRGQRPDPEAAGLSRHRHDIVIVFFDIVLIFDITHNLF